MRNKSGRIFLGILAAGLMAAAATVLASCGSGSSSGSGSDIANYKWSSTTAAIQLPAFVYAPTAPKNAVTAYKFALEHPELLSRVPCYCGCGQESGHKSNLDCFIKTRSGPDVTFDNHGAG